MSTMSKPRLIYMLLTKQAEDFSDNVQQPINTAEGLSDTKQDFTDSVAKPVVPPRVTGETPPAQAAANNRSQMLDYATYLRNLRDKAVQTRTSAATDANLVTDQMRESQNNMANTMKNSGGSAGSLENDLSVASSVGQAYANKLGLNKIGAEHLELLGFLTETGKILATHSYK